METFIPETSPLPLQAPSMFIWVLLVVTFRLHFLSVQMLLGGMIITITEIFSAKVMRAGDHAGLHGFRHPDPIYEIPDLGRHADQGAGLDAHPFGILRMHPDRIPVGYFIEPFGIAGARVNQRGQAEGRDQREVALIPVQFVRMDVALDVGGDRIFGPAPVDHGLGIELLLA